MVDTFRLTPLLAFLSRQANRSLRALTLLLSGIDRTVADTELIHFIFQDTSAYTEHLRGSGLNEVAFQKCFKDNVLLKLSFRFLKWNHPVEYALLQVSTTSLRLAQPGWQVCWADTFIITERKNTFGNVLKLCLLYTSDAADE